MDKRSETEFGILEENLVTLKMQRDKTFNSHLIKNKEKNIELERNNHYLQKKLDSINKRENVLLSLIRNIN